MLSDRTSMKQSIMSYAYIAVRNTEIGYVEKSRWMGSPTN
jgi:hypothetical protein